MWQVDLPVDQPSTRSEWVDQRLRRAILEGDLAPGEKLPLSELSQRWSVSPTPLREALQRLAAEGLVEIVPQRGARVAPVSKADLLDLYKARLLLEPTTLEQSIDGGDDEYRATVERTFEVLANAYGRENLDRAECEWAHRAFHLGILSGSGSNWMMRLIGMLVDHSARYRLLSTQHRGGADRVLEEHKKMRDACLTGDSTLAAELLRNHLEHTIEGALIELDDD